MNCSKRLFDLLFCFVLALPAFLVILLVCPFVGYETRAAPLFRQLRVGLDGKHFTILKLRTMFADTPDRASHEVGESRITKTGHVLRRTKIDELPQIWNVLVGEMSLVGPRPCLPTQTQLIEERSRLGVLQLKPGITGMAQVEGLDMSDPIALAQADAGYILPWSLKRDMRLLLQTAIGKGGGDAAVVKR